MDRRCARQPGITRGIDRFGQTGGLPDLYSEYRLGANVILDAAAELFFVNRSAD
jgi:pyruvate dehydrogenase complex dehydrogenase (E1) component